MKTAIKTHDYVGDGQTDSLGNDRCTFCRLPEINARHATTQITAEQREHDARLLGEHLEDDD